MKLIILINYAINLISHEKHGWQGSNFRMFAHYPTHIDAPSHHFQDGQTIDEVPLNRLMGAAALIDLSDHGRNAGITDDTLEERGHHTRPGDICILYTGWSDNWGDCWDEDGDGIGMG